MEKNNKILSDIVVFNKYAKYLSEKGRRETWSEIVLFNLSNTSYRYSVENLSNDSIVSTTLLPMSITLVPPIDFCPDSMFFKLIYSIFL